MGSLGYAKCYWCKTEGWNYYIPDGLGEPLCEKCLWEECVSGDNALPTIYEDSEENSTDQETERLAPELKPDGPRKSGADMKRGADGNVPHVKHGAKKMPSVKRGTKKTQRNV